MNHLLRLSDRSLHAAATFGQGPHDPAPPPKDEALRALADVVSLASVTLILGPSGAGKSRLLRSIASELVYRGMRAIFVDPHQHASLHSRTAVDLIAGPVRRVRELLGSCGLADARTFSRAARHLSVGETFRLLLARVFALRPDVVCIDEFGGSLDPHTLDSLCRTIRKAGRGTNLIVAGCNPQLKHMLSPDITITCEPGTSPRIERSGAQ